MEFDFKTKRDVNRFVDGKSEIAVLNEKCRAARPSEMERSLSGAQSGAPKKKRA